MDKPKLPYSKAPQQLKCFICGQILPTIICRTCAKMTFCVHCDELYHEHPRRQHHRRDKIDVECREENLPSRLERQVNLRVDTSHFESRNRSSIVWQDNDLYQSSTSLLQQTGLAINSETWQCDHCTFINSSETRVCKICCRTSDSMRVVNLIEAENNCRRNRKQTPQQKRSVSSTSSAKNDTRNKGISGSINLTYNLNKDSENTSTSSDDEWTGTEWYQPSLACMSRSPDIESSASTSNSGKWACESCTFENIAYTRICELCCKTRGDEPQKKISPLKKWFQDSRGANVSKKPSNTRKIKESEKASRNNPSRQSGNEQEKKLEKNISPEKQMASKIVGKKSPETKDNVAIRDQSALPPSSQFTLLASIYAIASFLWTIFFHRNNVQEVCHGGQNTESKKVVKKASPKTDTPLEGWMKRAKEFGFTMEDLEVALHLCETKNPVNWLRDHYAQLVEHVAELATTYRYGRSMKVGNVSTTEAKKALHNNMGHFKNACMECVEQRRIGITELKKRGNFPNDKILEVLSSKEGNVEAAFVELVKMCENSPSKEK